LDAVEYFAGRAAVTRALQAIGFQAVPYDVSYAMNGQNILSDKGFALALQLALRLKWGGFCMLAPVCSSWVWMSRAATKRSATEPMGDTTVRCVAEGNLMLARVVLLLKLLHAKHVVWVLEQPSSSLWEKTSAMQQLMTEMNIYKKFLWMGNYGGASPKPTCLYSNAACVQELAGESLDRSKFTKQTGMTRRYRDTHGAQRVSGDKNLKESQHYPEAFGHAIAAWYAQQRNARLQEAHTLKASHDAAVQANQKAWMSCWQASPDAISSEAGMASVIAYLK